MRFALVLVLVAFTVSAQEPAPMGLLYGMVAAVADSGIIDVKTVAGKTFRCHFDEATLTQRSHQNVPPASLTTADFVELSAGRKFGRCYARRIDVTALRGGPAARSLAALRPPARTGMIDTLFPRGNLTFAAVVLRHSASSLVVRTRSDGEKVLTIRDDTRFLFSGTPADINLLQPNTRVFLRAGKNIENELEVYQVIWGQIAGPSPGAP